MKTITEKQIKEAKEILLNSNTGDLSEYHIILFEGLQTPIECVFRKYGTEWKFDGSK